MAEADFKQYVKTGNVEARPYVPGEDTSGMSVQPGYTPKEGDMVARNPQNRDDQWIIAQEFFAQNYQAMAPVPYVEPPATPTDARLGPQDPATLLGNKRAEF